MISIDRAKAEAVLADLTLTVAGRAFADGWLALIAGGGPLTEVDIEAGFSSEIRARIIRFEITPQAVRILSAGHHIVEAVGVSLVGEDYLKMAPAGQQATRLARMCTIVEGHISTHQRWVVNTAGKLHVLNELALPCGLSEDGMPMIMTYVDTDSQGSVGQIPVNKGAMNIAPVFQTYAIH